ncbi:MAG: hypothetical protein NWS71_12205 [Opitutales bacterium]|nr:hypothetical protein [Opitutales bacterium]
MQSILETINSLEFLNNKLIDWCLSLGSVLILYLALNLMFSVLKRRLKSLSEKTSTVYDDLIAAGLESTKNFTLFVAALWGGAQFLDLGKIGNYLDFALLIAVTLQVAFWANRMVSAYIIFTRMRKNRTILGRFRLFRECPL